MAFADHHIEPVLIEPDEFRDRGRRIRSVGIADHDHVVGCGLDTVFQRASIAHIVGMPHDARAGLGGFLAGFVARSVVDDDNLERHEARRDQNLRDIGDGGTNGALFIQGWNDDGNHDLRAMQIRDWPKNVRVSGSISLDAGTTYLSKMRICALTALSSRES